ncbi:AGE family epimerase/isomerase [Halanaerobium salsuginis]|uniref:Cellobiose 2-epimerase n=1 Tax=Halanaerobium salsuginis TaxID=29563 RepID=A0A1I4JTR3_9FIRM|nr:AGE family epimerase/isomerase [Halanaerobium salsuginis]SFL69854.1 mannobiose 2-epimerase [Halanaerobium salsuginis]
MNQKVKSQLLELSAAVALEKDRLLDFWLKNSPDKKSGGFIGELTINNQPVYEADKALILNSRILWSFANAYRLDQKEEYLVMADRAANYLLDNFEDKEYGGFYWLLDYQGQPQKTKKQIYGQAFCIYAFSEYYRATEKDWALKKAVELFGLVENYSYDTEDKGYFEAFARDWSPLANMSLSPRDLNVAKSMNTHLHILEAYTNLYRIWPDPDLELKLKELIEVTLNNIVDQTGYNFNLFFDQDWTIRDNIVSYGHDIEGSWLIYEAAEILGDQVSLKLTEEYALKMANQVFKNGRAADGSLYYELKNGQLDQEKHWWPQAEAVIGFLNAYQLSQQEKFLSAAFASWQFISNNLVDQKQGGWFWSVEQAGTISNQSKINPWKSPYHNSRACYEVIQRVEKILN